MKLDGGMNAPDADSCSPPNDVVGVEVAGDADRIGCLVGVGAEVGGVDLFFGGTSAPEGEISKAPNVAGLSLASLVFASSWTCTAISGT